MPECVTRPKYGLEIGKLITHSTEKCVISVIFFVEF